MGIPSSFLYHKNDIIIFEEISVILSSSLILKHVLKHMFGILQRHLGVEKCVLVLSESYFENDHLKKVMGFGEDELEALSFSVWLEKMGLILSKQKPCVFNPYKQTVSQPKEKLSEKEFLAFPIRLGEENIGVFYCSLKTSVLASDQRLNLLRVICLMLGQELKLKRLMTYEREQLEKENQQLKEELKEKYDIHNMIGNSRAMRKVYELIRQVSQSNASILIQGESGTGKELVANAVHFNRARSKHAFIKINCGAIPENLIESELFGHEKGAFTDAFERKIGKFEAAQGGTIFLDEISELSLNMQVKLLRVLQEKEVHRIGSHVPQKIDVRVIAATNKSLQDEMASSRFRQDLFYRLNVFPIQLPPLRERRSDIVLLAEHFLQKFSKENQKMITGISAKAFDLLQSYHWPGNVRELQNYIERAVILCPTQTIHVNQLPNFLSDKQFLQKVDAIHYDIHELSRGLMPKLDSIESQFIQQALQRTNGNINKAAILLQITPRILAYKIQKLSLQRHTKKHNTAFKKTEKK